MKAGLYANINAKQERIKAGSKEKMRKPGTKGAPTAKDFKQAAKTAKKKLLSVVQKSSLATTSQRKLLTTQRKAMLYWLSLVTK